MKIGYARVSTDDQNLALQLDALERAGCEQIFKDEGISAIDPDRAGYQAAMAALTPGDMFAVWKLDRAYRSTVDAILQLDALRARGVHFQILTFGIDTDTPEGRLFYRQLASWAEWERDLISARTKEGMAAARRRGKHLGRPPKLSADAIATARDMLEDPTQSYRSVATLFGVHRSTLYRAVHREAQ